MTPYYQDDLVTIYHGDALNILPALDPLSLVVTDPPYYQPATHYVPTRAGQPIRSLGDTSLLEFWFKAWARAVGDLLTDDGSVYVFCDGQSYPITYRAFYALGRVRPLVWDKVTSFNGYTWRHQHELIAWIERANAPHIPTGDGDILRARSVPVADRVHPAQKPEGLVARLIEKHDAPVVLDPFMGGASTLFAAKQLGRKAIGIEIEERYCELAAQRCSQEALGLSFLPPSDDHSAEQTTLEEAG